MTGFKVRELNIATSNLYRNQMIVFKNTESIFTSFNNINQNIYGGDILNEANIRSVG